MSDSSRPPIKAVLFDFGGVMAEEGFREGLYAIASKNALDPKALHDIAMDTVYATGFVTGSGTESDFWRNLRGRFRLQDSDAELTRAILDRFVLRPHMQELVRTLRRHGILCGLLSDQTEWLDRLDARDHFYREFDKLYISCRLGKGKRDPSLFGDVVTDLGIMPREVVFVDDDPGNVVRAEARGLMGIRYVSEQDLFSKLEVLLGQSLLECKEMNKS